MSRLNVDTNALQALLNEARERRERRTVFLVGEPCCGVRWCPVCRAAKARARDLERLEAWQNWAREVPTW